MVIRERWLWVPYIFNILWYRRDVHQTEVIENAVCPVSLSPLNFKKHQTGEERKLLSDVSGHVSHPGMVCFP